MKKILLLFTFLLIISSNCNAQAFEWIKQYQTPRFAAEFGHNVSVDSDGNSLIYSAFFNDSIRIGNQLYVHQNSQLTNVDHGGYVVKYALDGSVIWSKQIDGTDISNVTARMDASQNIILVGYYKDSLVINSKLFSSPGYSVFLAKLDPSGNVLWAKSSSAPSSIPLVMRGQGRWARFDLDAAGNIYLTGAYYGQISFGNSTISTNSAGGNYYAAYLLKYDSNGNLQWLQNRLSDGGGYNIAVTEQGDIYHTETNQPSINILKKLNTNGVIQWTQNIPNCSMISKITALGVDKSGNAYLASSYDSAITLGSTNLPTQNNGPFTRNYYIAKINSQGSWKWVNELNANLGNSLGYIKMPTKIHKKLTVMGYCPPGLKIGDSTYTQGGIFIADYDTLGSLLKSRQISSINGNNCSGEALTNDQFNNTYIVGSFVNNIQIGQFQLNNGSSTLITRFLTKLQNYSNALTGTVFRDTNSNGIKDASESPFADRILEITPGPIYVNTLANGDYGTFLPADTFSISMPNPPRHYNVVPASHNFVFSGINQSITGKDFAVQPIPNMNDMMITISPSIARPGRTLIYNITYSNVGTTTLSDSIRFNFNSAILTYDSSSVAPVSQNTGQLSWYYQNLQPNEKRSINVYLFVDSTATLSTPLQALATILPLTSDQFIQDNFDTLNHVVSTSFDPNDKQVNRSFLTPAQVINQPNLEYTIRFQNTGNDTAFTVIIRDEFSSKLYVPSFELLSASHPYTFKLLENGLAEWRFDNILLPDSSRNEAASHGFIRYRMKPKSNLVLGDEIKSRAAIYFDFNAPVHTNYAVTRISLTNGIKEKNTNIQAFRLYPNPAKNYVMVEATFKKNTSATVSLINLLGQTISTVNLPANNQIHYQLPLNELPKGVYLIRLQTETGMQTQRLVIQ